MLEGNYMGRIIIKVKFQKTMKKKMMTILFLVSSSAIGACNNANKVDASKEAPRKRADSVEQDPVEVENERSTLYGFAVFGYITATLASFFIERDAQSKDTQTAGSKDIEGSKRNPCQACRVQKNIDGWY